MICFGREGAKNCYGTVKSFLRLFWPLTRQILRVTLSRMKHHQLQKSYRDALVRLSSAKAKVQMMDTHVAAAKKLVQEMKHKFKITRKSYKQAKRIARNAIEERDGACRAMEHFQEETAQLDKKLRKIKREEPKKAGAKRKTELKRARHNTISTRKTKTEEARMNHKPPAPYIAPQQGIQMRA